MLLKRGQNVVAQAMRSACVIEDMLGEGAQAEVYRVRVGDMRYALKWYLPEYLAVDLHLWVRLKQAIDIGAPSERFLWPFDLVTPIRSNVSGGYLMPIAPPEFVGFNELLFGKLNTSLRAITYAAFQLADSFLKLHATGFCYQDINFGNIFFRPDTGDIRIGDTDNVDINGKSRGAIKGTPGFMAPEIDREEVRPNAMGDRFSLAVLLFHAFMMGHPLVGRKQEELPYLAADPTGMRRLCTEHPVFIFDPNDGSNRPIPGIHDTVINFWKIYPQSLRNLFIRAFTVGLRDPHERVMEMEWRHELASLRDAIFACPNPKCDPREETQVFFDVMRARQRVELDPCWNCGHPLPYPPRMRIGGSNDPKLVVLSPGAKLYAHHIDGDAYNFSTPLAEVVGTPLGIRNLSRLKWTSRASDDSMVEVLPHSVLPLNGNCRIHFGKTEAEIKL